MLPISVFMLHCMCASTTGIVPDHEMFYHLAKLDQQLFFTIKRDEQGKPCQHVTLTYFNKNLVRYSDQITHIDLICTTDPNLSIYGLKQKDLDSYVSAFMWIFVI